MGGRGVVARGKHKIPTQQLETGSENKAADEQNYNLVKSAETSGCFAYLSLLLSALRGPRQFSTRALRRRQVGRPRHEPLLWRRKKRAPRCFWMSSWCRESGWCNRNIPDVLTSHTYTSQTHTHVNRVLHKCPRATRMQTFFFVAACNRVIIQTEDTITGSYWTNDTMFYTLTHFYC